MDKRQIEALAGALLEGCEFEAGDKLTADICYGWEGPGSWTRTTFEVTPEGLAAAKRLAERWGA